MAQTSPIVMAFCISDSYAQHAAVVMASALASNPDEAFAFHIFSGDLSAESQALLKTMEASGRLTIAFHVVDRTLFDAYPIVVEYFSQEIFYRYVIPRYVDAPRAIYSDVDVLICGSLRELWETPLTASHPIAAVREVCDGPRSTDGWLRYKRGIGLDEDTSFFYSGLLVMDCDQLRKEQAEAALFEDTTWCATHLDAAHFSASDQVVINRVFRNRILDLSVAYCVTDAYKKYWKGETIIRHYAGYYEKPWCNIAWNWYWGPYWLTLLRTPYRKKAWGFLWRHLWALVFSSHVKNGYRRYFLFGLRIYKKRA